MNQRTDQRATRALIVMLIMITITLCILFKPSFWVILWVFLGFVGYELLIRMTYSRYFLIKIAWGLYKFITFFKFKRYLRRRTDDAADKYRQMIKDKL